MTVTSAENGYSTPEPRQGQAEIVEKTIRTVSCPNKTCKNKIDITNFNPSSVVKCDECSNVTWIPNLPLSLFQKIKKNLAALIISFAIGAISSIVGAFFYQEYILDWLGSDTDSPAATTITPEQTTSPP